MLFLLATLALCAAPAEPPDAVVVCPSAFLPALEPWIEHRRAQGHRLAFVSNELSDAEIRMRLRHAARAGALKYVLLVGDAVPTAGADSDWRARSTPVHRVEAKVVAGWGSEPEIAADNWYADLDDDLVPDVAIGRLPADSPAELAHLVRRILEYEHSRDAGMWRRRINLVAGIGGFGSLVDTVVEMATKRFLTDGIPASYATTMTYASWQSPFCPDPRRFRAVAIERFNEGCLFWVYLGHGSARRLDDVRVPGAVAPILNARDAAALRCRRGAPIALLLSCYAGAFDQPDDCLAEQMLRAPGGPVAVICGSRVTMPYGMAVLSDALMCELFQHHRPTLGEVFLYAKRQMATESDGELGSTRQMLDALGAAFSPTGDRLRDERIEHLALFNLLGDPLLRLRYPDAVDLEVEPTVVAGRRLEVAGSCTADGSGVVELVCRRDRMRRALPERHRFVPTDAFLRSLHQTYREANDRVWVRQPVDCRGGRFQVALAIPTEARGPCYVRVFLAGRDNAAMGASPVFVRPLRAASIASGEGRVAR